jgi:predicted nuclease of restriction endonuclease-like (RecB) superfamily
MGDATLMNANRKHKKKVQQPAAQIGINIERNEPYTGTDFLNGKEYTKFLHAIKDRVRKTQQKAVVSVNKELILLYWDIGNEILRQQKKRGWGANVIGVLSRDLSREFPEMKGFSERNLGYMKSIAEAYPEPQFLQQVVAKLPWGHNCTLIFKVQDPKEREWYIQECLAHGWSRNVLVHQIDSDLYHRCGKAVTNFEETLPSTSSELAHQTIKDPYIFDFLGIGPEVHERDLERALLDNIRDFLLELGLGFSFVGSQYHMTIGGEDFYIDLLFYHLKLRCFIVVDLKVGEFQPEYAGKMSFYLSAIDRMLRHPSDAPSVGLILCRSRNDLIAEYTMSDMSKPMGVATYRLPKRIMSELPAPEIFRKRFSGKKKGKGSDHP